MNDLSICLSESIYTHWRMVDILSKRKTCDCLSITITCEIYHILKIFFFSFLTTQKICKSKINVKVLIRINEHNEWLEKEEKKKIIKKSWCHYIHTYGAHLLFNNCCTGFNRSWMNNLFGRC
jgi:hypothetical protein